jgi:cobalamin biosynthesis protein CobT
LSAEEKDEDAAEKEKSSNESHDVSSKDEDEEEEEEDSPTAAAPTYDNEVEEEVNIGGSASQTSKSRSSLPGRVALKVIAPLALERTRTTKWCKSAPVNVLNIVNLDSSEEDHTTMVNISSSAAMPVRKLKCGEREGTPHTTEFSVFLSLAKLLFI